MQNFQLSEEQISQFNQDGYLMVESLFDEEETDLLLRFAKADMTKIDRVHAAKDTEGRESKLWLTSDAKEDLYNAFVRCPRLAGTIERLMNDEVYLYHYKMMVKEPRVGGAWEWHQDYGYWYNNGCLFPDMASVMIAVDRAYKGNGCLQVIRGSHRLGRIEHGTFGTQVGAKPERVNLALKHLDLVYCEMKPGTALFFHANLLHRSDANTSDDPRWSLICCYNTRHNPCEDRPGHPSYRPLERWPDSRIKEIGRAQLEAVGS
ncbi:MAG: phytanoyl-CoA dioxygenase family protein [Planctomycetota bacterium]|nr:phytanoyl-CoA dioxygenase family protein [Planctomycetota bacterium]MDA1137937.1 phytanoyl-CoA dioxygenase family protein [Planctomycetota bacterium]